jgi:osmotically inducible lipoprotein OsmB
MEMVMRSKLGRLSIVLSVLALFSGCADMTHQQKGTAIGAGVGALGGAALTGGSALGTIGGAAVGGVVGHEVTKDKR